MPMSSEKSYQPGDRPACMVYVQGTLRMTGRCSLFHLSKIENLLIDGISSFAHSGNCFVVLVSL